MLAPPPNKRDNPAGGTSALLEFRKDTALCESNVNDPGTISISGQSPKSDKEGVEGTSSAVVPGSLDPGLALPPTKVTTLMGRCLPS